MDRNYFGAFMSLSWALIISGIPNCVFAHHDDGLESAYRDAYLNTPRTVGHRLRDEGTEVCHDAQVDFDAFREERIVVDATEDTCAVHLPDRCRLAPDLGDGYVRPWTVYEREGLYWLDDGTRRFELNPATCDHSDDSQRETAHIDADPYTSTGAARASAHSSVVVNIPSPIQTPVPVFITPIFEQFSFKRKVVKPNGKKVVKRVHYSLILPWWQ